MAGDWSGSKTELLCRLRYAEGCLGRIIVMIEHGNDWRSLVHQIWAVQGALREIKGLIVTHHLTACLGELLANTDQNPAACEYYLAEVMSLYELFGASRPPSN